MITGSMLLETAAQFQAAWYFVLLLLVAALVIGAAVAAALRSARPMWRAGDRPLAAAVLSATAIALALFTSMAVTAAVGLLVYGK